jgi:bacillithiol system protein YtxJ
LIEINKHRNETLLIKIPVLQASQIITQKTMNWIQLENEAQIDQIKSESQNKPVLIFKHSTRCSISSTALARLERNWSKNESSEAISPYYLDLIRFRNVSDQIARSFSVSHESPQVLLIHNKECVYNTSHLDINADTIIQEAKESIAE